MNRLMNNPWQDNIRELKNVLERAMILCSGNQITSRHIILMVKGQIERILLF